jgi:hypothetical protein
MQESYQETEFEKLFDHENRISRIEENMEYTTKSLEFIVENVEKIPGIVTDLTDNKEKLASIENKQLNMENGLLAQCRNCDKVQAEMGANGKFFWYAATILIGTMVGVGSTLLITFLK